MAGVRRVSDKILVIKKVCVGLNYSTFRFAFLRHAITTAILRDSGWFF